VSFHKAFEEITGEPVPGHIVTVYNTNKKQRFDLPACPRCGARDVYKRGSYVRSGGIVQKRLRCNSCLAHYNGEKKVPMVVMTRTGWPTGARTQSESF
jgi:hypothetical protein